MRKMECLDCDTTVRSNEKFSRDLKCPSCGQPRLAIHIKGEQGYTRALPPGPARIPRSFRNKNKYPRG